MDVGKDAEMIKIKEIARIACAAVGLLMIIAGTYMASSLKKKYKEER